MWDECNYVLLLTFFGIAFLWDWNENWPLPVLCHCWVFQFCWHIECSTFTASWLRLILGNCSHIQESPGLSLKRRFWFIWSRMNLRFFISHKLQVMLLLLILLSTPWLARSELIGTKHLGYCLPHQKAKKPWLCPHYCNRTDCGSGEYAFVGIWFSSLHSIAQICQTSFRSSRCITFAHVLAIVSAVSSGNIFILLSLQKFQEGKRLCLCTNVVSCGRHRASQVALEVKDLLANAGNIRDPGSIPGSGRALAEGNG